MLANSGVGAMDGKTNKEIRKYENATRRVISLLRFAERSLEILERADFPADIQEDICKAAFEYELLKETPEGFVERI